APFALLVIGRYGAAEPANPLDLARMAARRAASERDIVWASCSFGPSELRVSLAAAALGGHIRVGFENNLHLADGRRAADNAALIAQLTPALAALHMRPADAADAARIRNMSLSDH
ncbi:MAG: 3-keto-5-aminohexanoate cleavage protein, partial [Caulobacterales bacterium]|nr:3-keto-5-aminohexanoate cleavage protein [Caulobacterales bacterium]